MKTGYCSLRQSSYIMLHRALFTIGVSSEAYRPPSSCCISASPPVICCSSFSYRFLRAKMDDMFFGVLYAAVHTFNLHNNHWQTTGLGLFANDFLLQCCTGDTNTFCQQLFYPVLLCRHTTPYFAIHLFITGNLHPASCAICVAAFNKTVITVAATTTSSTW